MTVATPQRRVLFAGERLDATRSERLRDEADWIFAAGHTPIIDVRSVQTMDMSGLSALAWILIMCRRRNEAAYLLGPVPEPVARLLDLTAFDRFFQVRLRP